MLPPLCLLRVGVHKSLRVTSASGKTGGHILLCDTHLESDACYMPSLNPEWPVDTPAASKQRMALRHNPLVLEMLEGYWETCQGGADPEGNGTLEHEGYTRFFRNVFKTLFEDGEDGEEDDEAEMNRCIQDDWEHDSRGNACLSREGFFVSTGAPACVQPWHTRATRGMWQPRGFPLLPSSTAHTFVTFPPRCFEIPASSMHA